MTNKTSRRGFMSTAGTTIVAALAGCSSSDDQEEDITGTDQINRTLDGENPSKATENAESHQEYDCQSTDLYTGEFETLRVNETEYEIENIAVNDNGAAIRFNEEIESLDENDEIYLSGEEMELEEYHHEEGNNGTVVLEYGENC